MYHPQATELTYTGVSVAVEVEASTAGALIAANAVLTSLLAGSSQALISVCEGRRQAGTHLSTGHGLLSPPLAHLLRTMGDHLSQLLDYSARCGLHPTPSHHLFSRLKNRSSLPGSSTSACVSPKPSSHGLQKVLTQGHLQWATLCSKPLRGPTLNKQHS